MHLKIDSSLVIDNLQSARERKDLRKLFSSLPKNIGRVGNTNIPLEEWMHCNTEDTEQGDKRSGAILKAILAPDVEKPVIQGENQPLIFGARSIHGLLKNALTERICMNVGMSAGSQISPMLPAYLELGIQRLKELKAIVQDVHLRFFSTASLSPHLNGADPEQVARIQRAQHSLIGAYLEHFHSELFPYINYSDIQQGVPLLSKSALQDRIDAIRKDVSGEILKKLESCGNHHGDEVGQKNALAYAAYHPQPSLFADESNGRNIISVGGPGEALFNEVRFLPQFQRADPNVAIVVPPGLISRTPPYLEIPNGLSMSEFLEGSDRVFALLKSPKENKHLFQIPGARDLLHIAKCLSGRQDLIRGLEMLRSFYEETFSHIP
ncbi:hypothetical protein HZA38_05230 [Candidatus Peregrinibacteria bacterium]|nr:hypothetical protein [Candidatus Peregrinibacteria bacterium]